MKHIAILFMILLTTTTAYAQPNYTYEVIQPGEVYVNTTDKPQQIKIRNQDDLTGYEKTKDKMYKTTNVINDVVNNVRAITSLFGYNY